MKEQPALCDRCANDCKQPAPVRVVVCPQYKEAPKCSQPLK
jgi:hypothetical protein